MLQARKRAPPLRQARGPSSDPLFALLLFENYLLRHWRTCSVSLVKSLYPCLVSGRLSAPTGSTEKPCRSAYSNAACNSRPSISKALQPGATFGAAFLAIRVETGGNRLMRAE